MSHRICGVSCAQRDQRARAILKYFKTSIIITIGYSGTEIIFLVAMGRCNEEYLDGFCFVEWGGALTCKHLKMVFNWKCFNGFGQVH